MLGDRQRCDEKLLGVMRLPVVAVLIDLESGEIYWTVPRLPVLDDKASVTFQRESAVFTDGGRFVGSLRELATHPAQADELDRIPFIVESLERLEQHSWFDIGSRQAQDSSSRFIHGRRRSTAYRDTALYALPHRRSSVVEGVDASGRTSATTSSPRGRFCAPASTADAGPAVP